jgi:hypothetical protein
MMTPDHPHVRRSLECACCGAFKSSGRIACDDCWYDVWKTGTPEQMADAEEKLDAAEAALELAEEFA